MIDRALDAVADFIFRTDAKVVRNAIGLVLSGSLILLYAALRLTPKKIGA